MAEAKQFPLGDILSITTGRMLAVEGMAAVYEILNYMTGDNLFTHQLPRANAECQPYLLQQHPQLADVDLEAFDAGLAQWPTKDGKEKFIKRWLVEQEERYGKRLPVNPIPADDHVRKDPVEEAVEMFGPEKVIVVHPPKETE